MIEILHPLNDRGKRTLDIGLGKKFLIMAQNINKKINDDFQVLSVMNKAAIKVHG